MKRQMVILLIGLLLLTSCAESVKTEQKEKLKIGYLPITHAAPLLLDAYTADELEQSVEIELVKFNSWPDLIDALNAGEIDGASMLMQLAMQAKQIGVELKAIALGHEDGNVIVSKNNIDEVKELRGRTFAIPHTHSAHHLLIYELLEQEGVDYQEVNFIEMPPPEMPAALAEGRIAAYAVAEPFGAIAVQLGVGKVLAYSDEFWPNSYCCVLVLREEVLEEKESYVQQLVDRYVAAGQLADKKDDKLYEALQAYMNVEEEVLELSLQWIAYNSLEITKEEYTKLSERIEALQLMEEIPTYEEFVDLRFLSSGDIDG